MVEINAMKNLEICFINEHFDGVNIENDYCLSYFDGKNEELEAVLQKLQAINSISFVTVENHTKEMSNKRFTQASKCVRQKAVNCMFDFVNLTSKQLK